MAKCKTPLKTCSLEAERFAAIGPRAAGAEGKTDRGEDGIFFHGLSLHGCCEGHDLRHTRVPDLYQCAGAQVGVFESTLDTRWRPYAAVGGYSAGRRPMVRYLERHAETVKYAFVLDPSYPDHKDHSAMIAKWLSGAPDRRLLAIFGTASPPSISEEWIAALRRLPEEIRKHRVVVWRTAESHFVMKKHIRAMEEPSYQPPGGTADKDFAAAFS